MYKPDSALISFDDSKYRERLDIKYIFNKQIDRCLIAAGTEYFAPHVMALARMLPTASYNTLMGNREKFEHEKKYFTYMRNCGVKCGSETKPVMHSVEPEDLSKYPTDSYPVPYKPVLDDDGKPELDDQGKPKMEIDWDDPHILSPHRETEMVIDHAYLFRLIMDEAETRDLLWSTEEYAKVDALTTTKPAFKNPRLTPL